MTSQNHIVEILPCTTSQLITFSLSFSELTMLSVFNIHSHTFGVMSLNATEC